MSNVLLQSFSTNSGYPLPYFFNLKLSSERKITAPLLSFRKMGYKPAEIARKLKGLKTKKFHEMMFKQGLNLAKTPQWQRRGILVHKQPFLKRANNSLVERWKLKEDWNLPLSHQKMGQN